MQLISVACGEFGVGLQLKLLNCVQNLALQPCRFPLAASLACRGAGDSLVHALHAAPIASYFAMLFFVFFRA